ncbi:MAG: hypothetical protein P8X89_00600 [Reinekea sp.]
MLPKNFNEPMGVPTIFEKQIEIKLLHPAFTLESRMQAIDYPLLHLYVFPALASVGCNVVSGHVRMASLR